MAASSSYFPRFRGSGGEVSSRTRKREREYSVMPDPSLIHSWRMAFSALQIVCDVCSARLPSEVVNMIYLPSKYIFPLSAAAMTPAKKKKKKKSIKKRLVIVCHVPYLCRASLFCCCDANCFKYDYSRRRSLGPHFLSFICATSVFAASQGLKMLLEKKPPEVAGVHHHRVNHGWH